MKRIKIRTPIWKIPRSVGLAEQKLEDITEVEILYKTQDGKRLYPDLYQITKEKALKYKVDYQKGVKLHIIPINHLDIKEKKDGRKSGKKS